MMTQSRADQDDAPFADVPISDNPDADKPVPYRLADKGIDDAIRNHARRVTHDHLRAMVIYAFRYCCGRMSYAATDGIEIVRAYAHELEPFERALIAREIRECSPTAFAYGREWVTLAEELEAHP